MQLGNSQIFGSFLFSLNKSFTLKMLYRALYRIYKFTRLIVCAGHSTKYFIGWCSIIYIYIQYMFFLYQLFYKIFHKNSLNSL